MLWQTAEIITQFIDGKYFTLSSYMTLEDILYDALYLAGILTLSPYMTLGDISHDARYLVGINTVAIYDTWRYFI
jgi:hypothetical protein